MGARGRITSTGNFSTARNELERLGGCHLAFVSRKTSQFTYFAQQLGNSLWQGKDVLDFGGNIGNILRDPNSTIDIERYWCLDVDNEAIAVGRRSFPQAHWVWYNRYCFFFNPGGLP